MSLIMFESRLRTLIEALLSETRWDKLDNPGVESVLAHSFKMAWLVQALIAYEDKVGNPFNLDYFRLLQCAINHDIGESVVGDTVLPEKTEEDDILEDLAFAQIVLSLVGDLHTFVPPPIDRNPESSEDMRDFWKATEYIGYLLYALEQVAQGQDQFNPVVTHSLDKLKDLQRFDSVRHVYLTFLFVA
jgi:hypothetical protein